MTKDLMTRREHQVLALLALGKSNKGIAKDLGVTPNTAKDHVSHIIAKLDAVDRTSAVAAAFRRGLLR